MTDLSPNAMRLVEDARAQEPTLDRVSQARLKQAVLLAVAAPSAAAAATGWASVTSALSSLAASTGGKVVIGVAAAAVGAGTTLGVAHVIIQSPRTPRVAQVRPAPRSPQKPTQSPPVLRVVEEPLFPASPARRPDMPHAPAPARRQMVRERPPEASVPATPSEAVPSAPVIDAATPPLPAPDAAGLREELALLHAAMDQRAHRRPEQVLSTLDTYDERFPSGVLSTEARALRVLVLCDLGLRDDAESEAAALRKLAPDSPAVRRLAASCAAP